jgi:ribonuclease P protein component
MRRRSDFEEAVRGGRRAGRPSLVVHLKQTDRADPARVGFVVSRGVGPAVVRNQVKRRLRHVACERVGVLPSGTLVVVRANPAAAQRSSAQLAGDLDRVLATLMRGGEGRR